MMIKPSSMCLDGNRTLFASHGVHLMKYSSAIEEKMEQEISIQLSM